MSITNNTVATTAEATSFEFRTKFANLLNDENRSSIVEGFQCFCRMRPDAARKLLWNLTYRDDLTYSLEKLGMTPELIAAENLPLFRNELRHQYQQRHKNFLEIDIPASCQDAFNKLVGAISTVTGVVVFEQIVNRLFLSTSLGDPQKTIFLLGCEAENMYHGGLADIGFSKAEIAYLKPFRQSICELLKALYEHHQPALSATTAPNQPLAGLAKKLEAAGFEYASEPESQVQTSSESKPEPAEEISYGGATPATPVEPQHTETVPEAPVSIPVLVRCEASASTSLTAQTILEHTDAFAALVFSNETMALLHQLRACGFDLNEIVEKEAKINTLLKSADDLSA